MRCRLKSGQDPAEALFPLHSGNASEHLLASQLHMQRMHSHHLNVPAAQVRMLIASDQAALERFNSSLAESYVEVITPFPGL